RDRHALAALELRLLLRLEEMPADDAHREYDQPHVDEIAAVAHTMAVEEHQRRLRVRLAMGMAHAYAAPDLVEDRGGGKGADHEADHRPEVAHAQDRQRDGDERRE